MKIVPLRISMKLEIKILVVTKIIIKVGFNNRKNNYNNNGNDNSINNNNINNNDLQKKQLGKKENFTLTRNWSGKNTQRISFIECHKQYKEKVKNDDREKIIKKKLKSVVHATSTIG